MLVLVPPGEVAVIARLGRAHRLLASGRHFVLPLLDAVQARYPTGPFPVAVSATCRTKDDRPVLVEGTLTVEITDFLRASGEIADVSGLVATMGGSIAQGAVAARTRDEVRYGTREIEAVIIEEARLRLARAERPLPLQVTGCALSRIDTPALLA